MLMAATAPETLVEPFQSVRSSLNNADNGTECDEYSDVRHGDQGELL